MSSPLRAEGLTPTLHGVPHLSPDGDRRVSEDGAWTDAVVRAEAPRVAMGATGGSHIAESDAFGVELCNTLDENDNRI